VTRRLRLAATLVAGILATGQACAQKTAGSAVTTAPAAPAAPIVSVARALDDIFSDPILARALMAVRVESLRTGDVIYQRNSDKLVMPASNMKLLTMSVAAEKLGWDFKYETTLYAAGTVRDGVLNGDLVVVGGGDPTIGAEDPHGASLFDEWADALLRAGIRRVQGRLIGDDNAFDDDGIGPGWSWDDLADGYAARSSALSYNENVAVVRITPGAMPGAPATVALTPNGHLLNVTSQVMTADRGVSTSIQFARLPGSNAVTIRGRIAAGANPAVRTTSVDNPTRFFVEGFRLSLATRGIVVTDGASDIDDAITPPAATRREIARHFSPPLASIAASFLKPSQNFYGEMILKTLGRTPEAPGSTAGGRAAVRETLTSWGVPADSYVMSDGSGLSRYNYVSADAIVSILKHVWRDERLRAPFLAALPVAGHDGTLDTRMRNTVLDAHVQAKTGTIANTRSLSGFVDTKSGGKLVFSMIANNFTAPSAQIDAIVERALAMLVERVGS